MERAGPWTPRWTGVSRSAMSRTARTCRSRPTRPHSAPRSIRPSNAGWLPSARTARRKSRSRTSRATSTGTPGKTVQDLEFKSAVQDLVLAVHQGGGDKPLDWFRGRGAELAKAKFDAMIAAGGDGSGDPPELRRPADDDHGYFSMPEASSADSPRTSRNRGLDSPWRRSARARTTASSSISPACPTTSSASRPTRPTSSERSRGERTRTPR